jgi:hypothetical protein
VVVSTVWVVIAGLLAWSVWTEPEQKAWEEVKVVYSATAPNGKLVEFTSEDKKPPTDAELKEIFASVVGDTDTTRQDSTALDFRPQDDAPLSVAKSEPLPARQGTARPAVGFLGVEAGSASFDIQVGAKVDAVRRAYEREVGRATRSARLTSLWYSALVMLVPPFVLYGLGWAVGWVRRGFQRGEA